jgi:hypothetical protein
MTGYRAACSPLVMTLAFMLIQFSGISVAEELGRLFTTPEERSQLEKLRNPTAGIDQSPRTDDPAGAQRRPRNDDMTIRGFVYRKNGTSTIWTSSSHIHTYVPRVQTFLVNQVNSDTGDILFSIPDGRTVIRLRPDEMHFAHVNE